MKMNKKSILWIGAVVIVVILAVMWPSISSVFKQGGDNWPNKDITVVVPWNPGGGTDLTIRALADEMSKELGATIAVVNTPGASGSVGTIGVWNNEHDGYNILGNGMMAFTSYPVMGYTEQTHKDWHVWIATFSPNVFAVNEGSKYQNIEELINDLKNKPGEISVGTAGPGSGGHIGIEVVKSALGFEYNHIPYQGGNPAIVATLSGEVDLTPQLSMEMVDMLRAGTIRGLAALTEGDLEIEGANTIPSITSIGSGLEKAVPMGESFGIAVPKDTPESVVKKIDEAFKKAIESETLTKFASEKGVVVLALSGEESQQYLDRLASVVCWSLYEGGNATISPEEFGIPKP